MAILIIGATEQAQIAKAVAHGKAHPIPFEVLRDGAMPDDTKMLPLKDRKPGIERPMSWHIVLPGGYRCAYSVEQQPGGLCGHLSISVEGRAKPGMMPSQQAVQMIAEEYRVWPPDRVWVEEFDPGEFAVNVLALIEPTPEGHA